MFWSALSGVIGFWIAVAVVSLAAAQWLLFRKEHPVPFRALLVFNSVAMSVACTLFLLLSAIALSLLGINAQRGVVEGFVLVFLTALAWAFGLLLITAISDDLLRRAAYRRVQKELAAATT